MKAIISGHKRAEWYVALFSGLSGGYIQYTNMNLLLSAHLIEKIVMPFIVSVICGAGGVLGKKFVSWVIAGFWPWFKQKAKKPTTSLNQEEQH